ncbi:hypothetical protein H257_04240 [Aphanomyces astaci]|uniref:Uncharacterized protein n=1 Tax=Aphanomyces astaci TaxID=112090 RepID=W4GWY5_APHAT|nr:hypothetical protein H257_04240 [Aphanomyces astaci]ETV83529.1 hypothetical protein H257_04240 [Aphanomyces astaci]|eukprot:XP_009826959.1 hypothetical protein H257_04240 [Aphanomyces astaci]
MCGQLMCHCWPRRRVRFWGRRVVVEVAVGLEVSSEVARGTESFATAVHFAREWSNARVGLGVSSQFLLGAKPFVAQLERAPKRLFARVGKLVAAEVARRAKARHAAIIVARVRPSACVGLCVLLQCEFAIEPLAAARCEAHKAALLATRHGRRWLR